MRLTCLAHTLALMALLGPVGLACAQGSPLFSASSRSQGASFDLVVTETERLPHKSYLEVPGFHDRTAPGARWLMCTYTALAIERGFGYWFVVYPPQGSNRLVVGLSNTADARPDQTLGEDFNSERLVGQRAMPVERMVGFCGIKR